MIRVDPLGRWGPVRRANLDRWVVKGAYGLRRAGLASTVVTVKFAASIAFFSSSASAPEPSQLTGGELRPGEWGWVLSDVPSEQDGTLFLAQLAAKPDWLPTWLWAQTYTGNVAGIALSPPGVYPTPLYEVAMSGLAFAVLWSLRKHAHQAGCLFAV